MVEIGKGVFKINEKEKNLKKSSAFFKLISQISILNIIICKIVEDNF